MPENMTMRKEFNVTVTQNFILSLDPIVFRNVMDEDFKENLPNIKSEEDVAAHIAYWLFVRKKKLSNLHGWLDSEDSAAHVQREVCHVEAAEICNGHD